LAKKQLFWFFCIGLCVGKKPNVLFVLLAFSSMRHNGYVYGVVWRFEAQTCQTVTPFIRCNTLEISTIRQMHYTRCCVPVLSVRSLSVRWGSHTLWQVLVGV